MRLRKKTEKGYRQKKTQEQFAKNKAFPGSYVFPSAGTDSLPEPVPKPEPDSVCDPVYDPHDDETASGSEPEPVFYYDGESGPDAMEEDGPDDVVRFAYPDEEWSGSGNEPGSDDEDAGFTSLSEEDYEFGSIPEGQTPFTSGAEPGDGSGENVSLPDEQSGIPSVPAGALLLPILESKGKSSLTAVWQPIGGVDGYDVFFAHSGTDFGSPYATVSPEENAVTFSRLDRKTAYKSRVKAFVLRSGQKEYVSDSHTLRSITGSGTKKLTNAREILLKEERLDLGVGEKRKIAAEVIGQDPGKQVLSRGSALRYLSCSPEVASVTKNGKILGVGPGVCRIYLIAPNGVHASLEVLVSSGSGSVAFKKKQYSMKVGKKIDLKKKLKAAPESDDAALKWKSSDKDVADVDKSGVVKAVRSGKAVIRVESANGVRSKVRIRVSRRRKNFDVHWESVGSFRDGSYRKRSSLS